MVKSSNSKISFPLRLHNILDEVDEQGFRDVISWTPDGRAFQVHSQVLFAEVVMPIYFKTDKYKSFQRNLNLWGFRTVRRGYDKGQCSHPLFIRNKRDLLKNMKREQNGSSSGSGSSKQSQNSRLDQKGTNLPQTSFVATNTNDVTMKPSTITPSRNPIITTTSKINTHVHAAVPLAGAFSTSNSAVPSLPLSGLMQPPPAALNTFPQMNLATTNLGNQNLGDLVAPASSNPLLVAAVAALLARGGAANNPTAEEKLERLQRLQQEQVQQLQNAIVGQQLTALVANQLGHMLLSSLASGNNNTSPYVPQANDVPESKSAPTASISRGEHKD